MTNVFDGIFESAGCEGALCVRALDGAERGTEVAVRADTAMAPASVLKVQIALEVESAFTDGRLDPRERLLLRAGERTPGPVGLSLFEDDTELSLRDAAVLMLTISDNATTDALLRLVGVDAVNATAARLGLTGTHLAGDLQSLLDTLGRDLGRADWSDALAWTATASEDELADADGRLFTGRALDPLRSTRTTARDMAELLDAIWTDRAGPPAACARMRTMMGRQLTRHRLAAGFRPPVRVAAKSGSLVGVVRNEVGVVTHPDGRRYAAAVFTRSRPGSDDAAINRAIGTAASRAVALLRGERQSEERQPDGR
ncbi:serine hydrolase [Kitasatospora sp. NPDC088391]|uniref:serine hydrolase n=1 Tax=Kitasatospora sp. NPDC088391 TaxID=3364074 RepID=UPI0038106583